MRLRQTGHKRKLIWSIKKPRTIDKLTQELEQKYKKQKWNKNTGTKSQDHDSAHKYV